MRTMQALLYDFVFVPTTELAPSSHRVTLGLLAILLVLTLWMYWNFTRRYAEFPSESLLAYFMYKIVFKKIPKHLSFTSFAFQTCISAVQKFQNEEICLLWFGSPYLIIYKEEVSKLFCNEQNAVDKSSEYKILSDLLGTGLLTSNGETWRKHRKMLNPVFHVRVLKQKLHIFNKHADILVKKISELKNETSVHIIEYLKPCTFNMLCESIIGFKVNNQENVQMAKRLMHIIDEITELTVYRFAHPWLRRKFMLNFMPSGQKYLKMYEEIFHFVEKIVLDMKDTVLSSVPIEADSEDEYILNRKSFARILMEHHLEDPSYTIEHLKSEVITFILAGYDTTSHTLMWCLFLLGLHPDVQEQVYDEVQSIPDRDITYGDLQNLQYLKCVVKETLRLYPPVPLYIRNIKKDIQCGKYLVPKKTDVLFCPYLLHRDPKIYPDPETFDPARFLEGNSEKRPWTFTPFSEGIRSCIGKRFAMMEMMVVLTHILRNFKVTSQDKREDVDLCFNIILVPLKPLKMQFSARKVF